MSKKEIINFLGLATKAGKIVTGTDLVIDSVAKGKAKIVVISTDISDRSQKDIVNKTNYYEVSRYQGLNDEEIESAIGKKRKLVAITDGGMAKKFKELTEE